MTAGGVVSARELVVLRLEASDGTVGCGEAAPFEPYDGVPLERAIAALSGGGGRRPPQARAAEEMARLDLEARQEGRPLAEPARDALPVNMTLPAGPPEEVAERAREGAARRLRLLQGQGRAARGRRAGGRRARGGRPVAGAAGGRQPAPGRWTRRCARSASSSSYDLEFVEQPCRTPRGAAPGARPRVHPDRGGRVGRRRRAPCAAPSRLEACDVVNVKLAERGRLQAGPRGAAAGRARTGLGAFLSSTLDGPWGIAAALQLAAAEDLQLACGLATLELFDAPLARALPAPRQRDAEGAGRARGSASTSSGALADVVVDELPGQAPRPPQLAQSRS